MENFDHNSQPVQPDLPSIPTEPVQPDLPSIPTEAARPNVSRKLVPVYILIGLILIGEIAGFCILNKRSRALEESMSAGMEQIRSELSSQMAAVSENIEKDEGALKAVSENLGTLQEDHDELERTITEKVNAVSVAQKCANAVFYIEMYDDEGWMLGSGS